MPVTKEAAHTAYSWLIATPAVWKNTLRIFLQVPLKTSFNSFNLFKILMVPERIPAEKPPGKMSVMMEVETPFIAVRANRQKHMLISEIDLMGCDDGPIKLCSIPNMVRDRSCAMSLLVGDQKAVDRLCEKHIVVNPKPIAYRLGDGGTWLYGVPREMPLTINCPETGNVTQYLIRGHGLIKIPDKCIGSGPNFELPQHFQGRDALVKTITPKLATVSELITLSEEELKILGKVQGLSKANLKVLAQAQNLGGIEYIPLKMIKNHYSEEMEKFWEAPTTGYTWILFTWMIVGIIIVVVIIVHKKYPWIWDKCQKRRMHSPQSVVYHSKTQPELVHIVALQGAIALPPEEVILDPQPSTPPSRISSPPIML